MKRNYIVGNDQYVVQCDVCIRRENMPQHVAFSYLLSNRYTLIIVADSIILSLSKCVFPLWHVRPINLLSSCFENGFTFLSPSLFLYYFCLNFRPLSRVCFPFRREWLLLSVPVSCIPEIGFKKRFMCSK